MNRRLIIINRKKKFASALMPYWIITGESKEAFMKKHSLVGDLCKGSGMGRSFSRIKPDILKEYVPLGNGQSIQIELSDKDNTVFAITLDGNLSNEIILENGIKSDSMEVFNYTLTTKGGFLKPSYPWFIE